MKRHLAWIAFALTLFSPALVIAQEDQYVRVYTSIQEADGLVERNQLSQALAKYMEAQTALQTFQKGYPDWNPVVVKFRSNYVANKIAGLSGRVPAPPATQPNAPAAPGPGQPSATASAESQIANLNAQVRQLQSDKASVEAKLKEALSAQPPALDPAEVAKLEERVKSLQKENEQLNLSLATERSKPAQAIDTTALTKAQQELEDATRQLAEQKSLSAKLSQDNDALQSRVKEQPDAAALRAENEILKKQVVDLKAAAPPAGQAEAEARKLDQAMAEVAVLRSDKELLLKEKSTLEERLKSTPATSAQTSRPADLDRIKNLETERSELQQQLARSQKDLAAAQKGSGSRKVESSSKELAQARKQVETLQAEKDTLRLEKLALEGRLKQTMGSEGAATPAFAAQSSGDLKRVEAERDDLKRRLAAAEKELASRKGKAKPSKDSVKMEREIAELRARVAVLEAKPVPYSAEELALFRKAEPTLPAAASQPPASSTAANATLTTEAQKHFARNEFKEAESKLQKAVQQESTNATALAELAVTQIRQNNLDQAEKNAADAVTAAPDNAFAQQVMGHVKYRQGKYDEALNYMSRAAQLDPQNAETQNFLGVILSKKGMRGPAEAALRKAIQLQPNHGEAHNNLAVIYASQTPPLVELARWHYQKALAAGQPRNSELEKLLEKRASN